MRQLEKAESFIFLEFFIIREGIFWNTILEILQRKARSGVEVRVMYDDDRMHDDASERLRIDADLYGH